jgi:hypothetical protein
MNAARISAPQMIGAVLLVLNHGAIRAAVASDFPDGRQQVPG